MGSPTTSGDIQVKSDLFKDIKYYVAGSIASDVSIPPNCRLSRSAQSNMLFRSIVSAYISQIQKLLELGGATSTKIMVTNITHLLCGADFDENDIAEATDIYDIPSVTGEWVKASVKLGRLACTKAYHPIPSGLFTSLVIAVTQLSVSDRKKVYAFVTYHGGLMVRSITPRTTHLICGAATGITYNKAIEMKLDKLAIVTPDWLFECIKSENLLDTQPYHPRLLNGTAQNLDNNQSLSSILGIDTLDSHTIIDKTDAIHLDPNKNTINSPVKTTPTRESNMSRKLHTPKSISLTHNKTLADKLSGSKNSIDGDLTSVFSREPVMSQDDRSGTHIDPFSQHSLNSDNTNDRLTDQDMSLLGLTDIDQSQKSNQLPNGSTLQTTDLQQCQPKQSNLPHVRLLNINTVIIICIICSCKPNKILIFYQQQMIQLAHQNEVHTPQMHQQQSVLDQSNPTIEQQQVASIGNVQGQQPLSNQLQSISVRGFYY